MIGLGGAATPLEFTGFAVNFWETCPGAEFLTAIEGEGGATAFGGRPRVGVGEGDGDGAGAGEGGGPGNGNELMYCEQMITIEIKIGKLQEAYRDLR